MPGSRWQSAAPVRIRRWKEESPPSQFDRRADSWVDYVPDDHCNLRWHLDQFTPIDANNARQYALDAINEQAKDEAYQEELSSNAEGADE